MSKRQELKTWLKETAIKIREARNNYKKYWRDNGPIVYNYNWDDYQEDNKNYHKMLEMYYDINKMKKEYRHRHIAYSQLRGKTRNQIESSCNIKPDEEYIKKLMKEYSDEPLIRSGS
ncbi:MAG: hypothetical protein ACOCV1_00725 [Bacillota bacterium]